MTVKLPKMRNNLPEEMNPELYYFKKHVLSTNFHGSIKEALINFSIVREYGRHMKKYNFDLSKNHEYTSNLLYHYYHEFQQICSRNILSRASLYLIQSKFIRSFIYSFFHFKLAHMP